MSKATTPRDTGQSHSGVYHTVSLNALPQSWLPKHYVNNGPGDPLVLGHRGQLPGGIEGWCRLPGPHSYLQLSGCMDYTWSSWKTSQTHQPQLLTINQLWSKQQGDKAQEGSPAGFRAGSTALQHLYLWPTCNNIKEVWLCTIWPSYSARHLGKQQMKASLPSCLQTWRINASNLVLIRLPPGNVTSRLTALSYTSSPPRHSSVWSLTRVTIFWFPKERTLCPGRWGGTVSIRRGWSGEGQFSLTMQGSITDCGACDN